MYISRFRFLRKRSCHIMYRCHVRLVQVIELKTVYIYLINMKGVCLPFISNVDRVKRNAGVGSELVFVRGSVLG